MQAIIMAAGKGSRLGKLTNDMPKSFLEIKGKRIIDINLAMLHRYGIWDIVIVTGFHDEKFVEVTRDIPGITLVYNPFYDFTNVIGSYFMGMSHLHDDFIYLHADTICDFTIFEDLIKAKGDIVLPVDSKPCDDEAMKVRIDNGEVVEITKQMSVEVAAGEFIGITKIKKNVINDLNYATVSLMRKKEFSSYFEGALQKIIDMKKYNIQMLNTRGHFWSEIDFMEDYQKAERRVDNDFIHELFN